jgi:hypothetical protein
MKPALLLPLLLLAACTVSSPAPFEDHDETSDFASAPNDRADTNLGVAPTFAAANVMTDAFLTNATALDVAGVQALFETSPYGTRSWLADATVGGDSAAAAVVAAATAEQINPLALVARMQVESSLVSKTARPSQHAIDRALGCGCPDGAACAAKYAGLDKQLACAAHTLRKLYDASADGSGQWRAGHATRTLDPRTITPANDATAALYAYTPWVLVGSGGTWLVWNVTRKFARQASALGVLAAP